MRVAPEPVAKPVIVGRSSSHFTRVVRIFAAELAVDCSFQVVRDLMSVDAAEYGGNPALKLPTLVSSRGVWFGALSICRELARCSRLSPRLVWPEELEHPLASNAQELVVQGMSTEVTLIMAKLPERAEATPHQLKMRDSLVNTLVWLDTHVNEALATLRPDRDLSYLEVTLFCLITHLEFREVLPIAPYAALNEFCRTFAPRPSVASTAYRFDPIPDPPAE